MPHFTYSHDKNIYTGVRDQFNMNIANYGLYEKYNEFSGYGDRLSEMGSMINWEQLRPLLGDLYASNTAQGGAPNYDPVLMVKILFLQSVYNPVDDGIERELHNRIDFMHFLNFPDRIPDSRTVWFFRERLSSTGKDKAIWKNIWGQFDKKGITVKKGTVQDAASVESDPGKHGKNKPPEPEDPVTMPAVDMQTPVREKPDNGKRKLTGEERRQAGVRAAENKRNRRDGRKYSKTGRSEDGTWAEKGNRSHSGYRMHTDQGTDIPLIKEFAVTTASLHGSKIDPGMPGITDYRDKGYSGKDTCGRDGTMDRASGNHPLTIDKIRRNRRITKKRSPGERPYSVIKRIFNGGHVSVTVVRRVRVKAMFMCSGYNLFTPVSMENRGRIAVAIEK